MMLPKINNNWFSESAELYGSRKAVVTDEMELTYQQLADHINEKTKTLTEKDINRNDIVGLFAEHSYQFIVDLLSVWKIGGVVFPISTKPAKNEIDRQIKFTGCKLLADKIVGKNSASNKMSAALIMFTSGTTGENKSVVHTYNSLFASASSIDKAIHLEEEKKWLASLPFYRIGGFQIIIRTLLTGGTLCIPQNVSTKKIIDGVNRFKPDYISLVNATYRSLLQSNTTELKNTKAIFVGGGPVESSLFKEGISKGLPVYKVYGSTETGSMISILKPEEAVNKIDSAGKPLPGVKIKVKQNEILVSTDSLFTGYYKNESLTKEKIENGWYKTGDIGYIDDDGFLFVMGRKDNIIISGGEKIDPKEIEFVIKKLSYTKEVVVFGVPDEKWGQKICAAVLSSTKLDVSEIQDKLKEILPSYKIPKMINQIEKIPVDEMGKVNLSELQNLFN
ncbi:long-chain-fatty-acid--coa ligase [hydrocarbon metagenome]|uniref:Long-chain-fatty-acid--coa ligase n=1 Tax=hydrocarbon metagenome TaxID=938273 RepID=A0A0W8G073_9ZZZZ